MSEFKVGDRVRLHAYGDNGVWSPGVVTGSSAAFVHVKHDRPHPRWGDKGGWYPESLERLAPAASDPVNHPAHYTQFPVEVIDITEHLSFNLGNVVKYACRAGRKDGADPIEDLRKAEFYLKREIGRLSSE